MDFVRIERGQNIVAPLASGQGTTPLPANRAPAIVVKRAPLPPQPEHRQDPQHMRGRIVDIFV
jgi:hypothetical protein